MTPLPVKGIIGNIEILVRGQMNRRAELKPGSDALEATIDLAGVRKFIAAVTLVIDGKALTPRFSIDFRAHHRSEQGASEDDASHAHPCEEDVMDGLSWTPDPFRGQTGSQAMRTLQ